MSSERTYRGESVDVTFDGKRCIHAKECVKGLPEVFDPKRRPWILPDAASAESLAAVVRRCPTGALHAIRKDASAESPGANQVTVAADGPLYVSGDVVVKRQDGSEIVRDTRLALCRCGASKNKPFCDGAHTEAGFEAPGASELPVVQTRSAEEGPFTFLAATDGPLLAEGACELLTEDGAAPEKAASGSYCRCGASLAKPFCDGSHYAIGFQVE